jgi:hypothetical protein
MIRTQRYPLTSNATMKLAALMAQMEWGDHYPLLETAEESKLSSVLLRFYPEQCLVESARGRRAESALVMQPTSLHLRIIEHRKKALSTSDDQLNGPFVPLEQTESVRLMADLSDSWSRLRGFAPELCADIFLSHTLQWSFAAFYQTFLISIRAPFGVLSSTATSHGDYLLAIGADGIGILASRLMVCLRKSLITSNRGCLDAAKSVSICASD